MASTSRQSEIPYAFDEIAPPSICASAKSSTSLEKPPCHVFINHRGPDVEETLARAIYHVLHVKGLGVFLDSKELELGDLLPEALQKAMSSASLHVAIFSPGYAQSPWCLAELSFMLKTGTPIIPVFYGVQPTDLRWVAQGKGLYAGAFSEHQEKGRYSLEKLQKWKMALHNVSFYMGEIINNNEYSEEQTKLKNIVNRVSKEMKVLQLTAAKHPVGLEAAVADNETPACEFAKNHPLIWLISYILSLLLLFFSNEEKFQNGGMILNAANDGVHKVPAFLLNTRRNLLLGLKVVVVKGNYRYNLSIVEFSTKSKWPCFTGIADRNLPLTMENLRVLELNQSGLEDFRNREPQAPEPLRVLIISFCPNLRINTDSIQFLKYIAQLSLNRSANVKSLLDDFHCLRSPDHLKLKSCELLSPVPSFLGHLRNFRHLNLTHSGKQRMLPEYFKQFNLLQHLNLAWCSGLALRPDLLENITKPEYLNFSDCRQLKELPSQIANLAGLRELYSEETYSSDLPMDTFQISKLRARNMSSRSQMQALPVSICSYSVLEQLVVEKTCRYMLGMESLDQMKGLRKLQLDAKKMEDVEPCSPSIESVVKLCNRPHDHVLQNLQIYASIPMELDHVRVVDLYSVFQLPEMYSWGMRMDLMDRWHPDASLSRLTPTKLTIASENVWPIMHLLVRGKQVLVRDSQLTLAFAYGYEYALGRQIEAGANIPLTQSVHTPPTKPWIGTTLMGTIVTVVMVDGQGSYLHEGLKHYIEVWTFAPTWITRAPSMDQAEEELLGIVSAPRTQTEGESVTTIKNGDSINVAKEHAQEIPSWEGSILMLPLWVVTDPRWQIRDLARTGEWWNFDWISVQIVPIVDLRQNNRDNYRLVESHGQHLDNFEPLVRQPATYEEQQIETQMAQDQPSLVIVVRYRVQIEREEALFEVHIITQEREQWLKNTTVASREQAQSHQGETIMMDEIQRLRTEILELRAERETMQAEVQKLQEEVVRLRAGLATS